jgi:hypothetical protein
VRRGNLAASCGSSPGRDARRGPGVLLLLAAALSPPTAVAQGTQPVFTEFFAYDPAAPSQLLGNWRISSQLDSRLQPLRVGVVEDPIGKTVGRVTVQEPALPFKPVRKSSSQRTRCWRKPDSNLTKTVLILDPTKDIEPLMPGSFPALCEISLSSVRIPLGAGARQMVAPFHRTSVGDFLVGGLPFYVLRTVMRRV